MKYRIWRFIEYGNNFIFNSINSDVNNNNEYLKQLNNRV